MTSTEEAKRREKSFLENIGNAQDDYDWLIANEAWTELGHATFGDWWEGKVQPLMRALSMRPTREIAAAGVVQAKRENEQKPPAFRRSNAEIGEMFGVSKSAVQRISDPPGLPDPNGSEQHIERPYQREEKNFLGPVARPAPTMLTLRTHKGDEVDYPKPAAKATFNETTGDGISWANWSWNPVTGCLHGCDYCYARAIAARFPDGFPAGFTPLFHHERLDAPANTVIPARGADDPAYRRVFVCSMADLYGRWVPDEWIQQVHASMLASPQWEYLLLTKFPARYVGLDLPANAWVGTSVDEQKRVRIAEDAFRKIDGVKVKWLSLEPLKEPLEFTDLSMFDWVVIGAQTATRQPDGPVDAFAPPFEWVARIVTQALDAGCRVHMKPNLFGNPGMVPLDQYPEA